MEQKKSHPFQFFDEKKFGNNEVPKGEITRLQDEVRRVVFFFFFIIQLVDGSRGSSTGSGLTRRRVTRRKGSSGELKRAKKERE